MFRAWGLNVLIFLFLLSGVASANEERPADIRAPMFGGGTFSAAQQENNERLIQQVVNDGLTRTEGAAQFARYGWGAINERKPEEAMKQFNTAWLLDQEYGDIYTGFASLIMTNSGEKNIAEQYFQYAISQPKGTTVRHVTYGQFLIQNGRKHEAQNLLHDALRLDKKTQNARAQLAIIALGRRDVRGACVLARQAKENGDKMPGGFLKSICAKAGM